MKAGSALSKSPWSKFDCAMIVQAMRCLAGIHRRLARQDHLRDLNGARQILRRENLFGRARQHAGAVRMLGEGLRELHAGIGGLLVPLGLCGPLSVSSSF